MTLFQEEDYSHFSDLVERLNTLEVAPKDKEPLLKSVLTLYTGNTELPKLHDFEFCEEVDELETDSDGEPIWYNCICSQRILNPHYIEYKPKALKFKVGRNCFENLYGKLKCDEIHFFKPYCLNCKKNKVPNRRTKAGKEGCCCDKCMNIYRKKIPCSECDERFWRIHPSHTKCKKCYFKTFYGYRNPEAINI